MRPALFSPKAPASHRTPPLLVDIKELARLLARSEASLLRDVDAARLPPPVKIGRSTRWRRSEIEGWLAAGCPAPSRVAEPDAAGENGGDA